MNSEHLDRLLHSRNLLKTAIDSGPSARDLASLSREYRAILTSIDALGGVQVVSAADELAAKRRKTSS